MTDFRNHGEEIEATLKRPVLVHTVTLTERELRIVLAAMDVTKEIAKANSYGSVAEFEKLYDRLLHHRSEPVNV